MDNTNPPSQGDKKLMTLIVAGFQKCGTSVMAAYLSSHPEIAFSRIKEVHHFDVEKRSSMGLQMYSKNWPLNAETSGPWSSSYVDSGVRAEATPYYASSDRACGLIAKAFDSPENDYRLVVMLRDPTARAWSEYKMEMRRIDDEEEYIEGLEKVSEELVVCFGAFILGNVMDGFKGGYDKGGAGRDSTTKEDAKKVASRNSKNFRKCIEGGKGGGEITKASRFKKVDSGFVRVMRKARKDADKMLAIQKAKECFVVKDERDSDGFNAALEAVVMQTTKGRQGIEELMDNNVPGGVSLRVGCFGEKWKERLEEPEEAFDNDIEEWMGCVNDGGVIDADKWNSPDGTTATLRKTTDVMGRCYDPPVKGIVRQFLYRSMYAPQIQRCVDQGVPEDKIFIVDDEQFKREPVAIMDGIHEFAGVSPFTYDALSDEKALSDKINQQFPIFEKTTGWRLNGEGLTIPPKVEAKVKEFFLPFNRILVDMLESGVFKGTKMVSFAGK